MKGKRTILFQFGELEMDYTALKKLIEKELKKQGIKSSDDVNMYFKIEDRAVYVVTDSNSFKVELC